MGGWKPSQPPKPYFDDFAGGRRGAPRCEVELSVAVRFAGQPLWGDDAAVEPDQLQISGETRNLSETGLAISVATNHIGGRYFNVIGCTLDLRLDLPDEPVHILATPAWSKWFVEGRRITSYLLGLRIVEMSDEEWVRLVRFVHARLE